MKLSSDQKRIVTALIKGGVIVDDNLNRARLFSVQERRVIRTGLRKPGSGWECIEGGAGLMDEFEMVNFKVYGLDAVRILQNALS